MYFVLQGYASAKVCLSSSLISISFIVAIEFTVSTISVYIGQLYIRNCLPTLHINIFLFVLSYLNGQRALMYENIVRCIIYGQWRKYMKSMKRRWDIYHSIINAMVLFVYIMSMVYGGIEWDYES